MSDKNTVIAEVTKRDNEAPGALLKRFSRKVQRAGIVKRARSTQFRTRDLSHKKQKGQALRKIEKDKKRSWMKKLGKKK